MSKKNEDHKIEEGVDDDGLTGDETVADRLKALEDEKTFLLDQLQRARAEFDNFRRRSNEERLQGRRRMTADVLRLVLPVYDDLVTAVGAEQQNDNLDKLKEGLELIANKFRDVLSQMEVESIEEVGIPFDPTWHEAVFNQECDEMPEGHVMEVFERGYRLGEDLLRAARVKVSKAKAGSVDESVVSESAEAKPADPENED